jgi:geranylgeranyl diphosphate synthase type II
VELAYRAFARELGRLFQLVDDILDVDGSEDALGKPVGTDARHDRASAVTVLGLDRAREAAREGHARALALLSELPGPVEGLLALTDLAYARRH